jgi:2-methylaconitate cis-trans-isomerase PrpF
MTITGTRTLRSYLKPSLSRSLSSLAAVSNPLPATFLRGGTSKGIFINRKYLPKDTSLWTPIFLGIMGSPDPVHARQLNGMGGAVSSLSKICVVGEKGSLASPGEVRDDVDVEYTFAQVGIRDDVVDYSGNCGNLSTMIGVFAVDEGMCKPRLIKSNGKDHTTRGVVRSFNTNTHKRIDTTFPVRAASLSDSSAGEASRPGYIADLGLPEATVAGVPGEASRIDLDITNPAGARTGQLLPTGRAIDDLEVYLPADTEYSRKTTVNIPATLIDAANPSVFVLHDDLVSALRSMQLVGNTAEELEEKGAVDYLHPAISEFVERIRRAGAIRMGLDPNAQAQPKIAIAQSIRQPSTTDYATLSANNADVHLSSFSMGVLHRAIPMTLGLCAGVAAGVKGTILHRIVNQSRLKKAEDPLCPWEEVHGSLLTTRTRIAHPSGTVDVGAVFATDRAEDTSMLHSRTIILLT